MALTTPFREHGMNHTLESSASGWVPVPAVSPAAVSDARLQLHHAAQVANAPAMSWLPPAADDSHTNFGWSPDARAFISQRVPFSRPRRFALRPADPALLALDDSGTIVSAFALTGQTLDAAHAWARAQCEAAGGERARYTPRKHYEIPAHPVASGATFGTDPATTRVVSQLWDNATRFLEAVRESNAGASDVRLWPHHFDLGLIITIGDKRSIGAGFTLGDHYYDEPYWYVSPDPRAAAAAKRPALEGGAHWHEVGFFSAVLPWHTYVASGAQGEAVMAYLRSALNGARSLLGG
jgi:hypothetical protein